MKYIKGLSKSRLSRFLLVGAGNTTINFVVLNSTYYRLHTNRILSSLIATCCAIAFSFTLNRHYVFSDKTQPIKKFALFVAISALGTLLIQTSIYAIFVSLIRQRFTSDFIVINLSTLVASLGAMLWNYNGYRLLVFKGGRQTYNTAGQPSGERDANYPV